MSINSHIQMPKAMFKRFENTQHCLCYYSVKDDAVRNEGHARTLYTEDDYFSEYGEKYLNHNYENPFQRVLQYIDEFDFEHSTTSFPPEKEKNIRNFMYSLIARSPGFLSEGRKTSVSFRQTDEQAQHDKAAIYGTRVGQELDILKYYKTTLVENESSTVFVLPTCGIYSVQYKGTMLILLPISPIRAIALIDNSLIGLSDNTIHMPLFSVSDETVIEIFNKVAFRIQCNEKEGFVVANEETVLVHLKEQYNRGLI